MGRRVEKDKRAVTLIKECIEMLNATFTRTIIDGLECCSKRPKTCSECPYQGYKQPDDGNYPDCQELLMINALSKLKYPKGELKEASDV